MPHADSVLDLIGNTPLIRLGRVGRGLKPLVLAKLEMFNPGGSVKDRIGWAMIEEAERAGLLRPGGTIIEPTSGNTGVGLALVAALRGYRIIFTIPDKMSREKIDMLKAFGAEVVVTPTAVAMDDPRSYYETAKRLHAEIPNSYLPFQYSNPRNPEAHYRTTGPEIWCQTEGRVTHLVCGMGTGGTVTGTGRFLKERNSRIWVIGVDPVGSILADRFEGDASTTVRPYLVEGIGEEFVPEALDFRYVDQVIQVADADAFRMARSLAREEGLLVGGSSGAAAFAALRVARDLSDEDVVVTVFPDSGIRYLSKVHSEEWLRAQGFLAEQETLARSALSEPADRVGQLGLGR